MTLEDVKFLFGAAGVFFIVFGIAMLFEHMLRGRLTPRPASRPKLKYTSFK